MAGSDPTSLAEKRRTLLRLQLRRKREEALARKSMLLGSDQGEFPSPEPGVGSALVPLRAAGTKPPLFLVHAAGGSVTPYAALTALLGEDQPVYAMEDPGLRGGMTNGRPLSRLADTYLADIRRVQADGPLRLGGWSVGGAIALEMANLADDVALTLILDTAIPDGSAHPVDDELRAWFAADVAEMGTDPGEVEVAKRFPVFAANVRALLTFCPSRVGGRVVVLCAGDSAPEKVERWRDYADEIRVIPGTHYTMLQPPQVAAVAEAIRDELAEVSAR